MENQIVKPSPWSLFVLPQDSKWEIPAGTLVILSGNEEDNTKLDVVGDVKLTKEEINDREKRQVKQVYDALQKAYPNIKDY